MSLSLAIIRLRVGLSKLWRYFKGVEVILTCNGNCFYSISARSYISPRSFSFADRSNIA